MIDYRLVILFSLLTFKLLFGLTFYCLDDKDEIKRIWYILLIILTILYIAGEVFNVLVFVARNKVHYILNYYEHNIKFTWDINMSNFNALFAFDMIFSIADLVVIGFGINLIFNLRIEENYFAYNKKNEGLTKY